MTPKQLHAARKTLGLSRRDLAVVLGVSERTVQRWESTDGSTSHRGVNETAARVVSWMLAGFDPKEYGA